MTGLLLPLMLQAQPGQNLTDLNQESIVMPQAELLQRAETEIVQLHQFFQDWYRGLLKESGFARFEQAMHEDFHIIMPNSNLLRRAAIINAVRQQHGSDPETTLEIRNVRLASIFENTAVFMYEEWQGSVTQEPLGRLSTVLFVLDDSAPNGLIWLHVHETWLAED